MTNEATNKYFKYFMRPLPLGVVRNVGTQEMNLISGDAVVFASWNSEYRKANASCAFIDDRGYWQAVDCDLPIFTGVMCASSKYTMADFPAQVVYPNDLPMVFNDSAFVKADLPKTGLSSNAYGVTVMSTIRDCPLYDTIYPATVPYGTIAVVRSQHCILMATGTEILSRYNDFLLSLMYATAHTARNSTKMSYVYWTTRYFTNLVLDIDTSLVYGSVVGRYPMSRLAGYATPTVERTVCGSFCNTG